MKIPIVIVSYNRKDMLEKCLAGIRENTNCEYELILVDNGSDEETREYIYSQRHDPDVKCVSHFTKNEGFAIGYSDGLEVAFSFSENKYAVIINNDTIPYKNWLQNMKTVFEEKPEAGIVLPFTNFACNQGIVREKKEAFETETILINGDVPAVCWMISKKCYISVCEVIEKINGGKQFFHKDFKYGWAEDILTSKIITSLNYQKYAAGKSFIYHYGTATQNILKDAGNYREENMNHLGKYLKKLDEI